MILSYLILWKQVFSLLQNERMARKMKILAPISRNIVSFLREKARTNIFMSEAPSSEENISNFLP